MNGESASTIRRYDWADVSPSVAVVETLSVAMGVDAIDVPTLNDALDTDALDAICANGAQAIELTLSFVHAGHDVTVLGDGTVIVGPSDEHAPSANLSAGE
ncbi:HalOD1 output domain-containing protein [Halorubrum trueperi]|uniref:HalOD1 output domain-containing protein n=1 Tax=Halorubrum trueperi TaxID=2004704 RepID=A0ABD5UJ07_9EURY